MPYLIASNVRFGLKYSIGQTTILSPPIMRAYMRGIIREANYPAHARASLRPTFSDEVIVYVRIGHRFRSVAHTLSHHLPFSQASLNLAHSRALSLTIAASRGLSRQLAHIPAPPALSRILSTVLTGHAPSLVTVSISRTLADCCPPSSLVTLQVWSQSPSSLSVSPIIPSHLTVCARSHISKFHSAFRATAYHLIFCLLKSVLGNACKRARSLHSRTKCCSRLFKSAHADCPPPSLNNSSSARVFSSLYTPTLFRLHRTVIPRSARVFSSLYTPKLLRRSYNFLCSFFLVGATVLVYSLPYRPFDFRKS